MAIPSGPVRLELELDSHEGHIEGRIGDGYGQPLPFTGWLELMAALEALAAKRPGPTQRSGGHSDE
jgi:hypothetical protein